jgi:hypothetical protein
VTNGKKTGNADDADEINADQTQSASSACFNPASSAFPLSAWLTGRNLNGQLTMTADRVLWWLLRINAYVLLLAAPCALLPFAWMDAVHREALGLGDLADAAITKYMARSLSLVYAGHGVVLLFVTLHWERLRFATPLVAWLHVGFGAAMVAVDLDAGLPTWWVAGEGPPLVVLGFAMLWLYRSRNVVTS